MTGSMTHAGHRSGRGEAQGADEQPHVPGFKRENTHTHRFWARERGRLEASYSMSSVRE